eukprot:scaffold148875_cov17-Prasinocladus_malaysianus.AAC.1
MAGRSILLKALTSSVCHSVRAQTDDSRRLRVWYGLRALTAGDDCDYGLHDQMTPRAWRFIYKKVASCQDATFMHNLFTCCRALSILFAHFRAFTHGFECLLSRG